MGFLNGKLVATDNYSKVAGVTSLDYTGLARGDRIELQANVKGTHGGTEVVDIATEVKLRPDLEPGIQAPASVDYNSPFSVVGRVREMNGDVGARFDCRLFADDVQVGEILGAWVDAGQEVACHFTTRLASLGSKRLVVRADGVAARISRRARSRLAASAACGLSAVINSQRSVEATRVASLSFVRSTRKYPGLHSAPFAS